MIIGTCRVATLWALTQVDLFNNPFKEDVGRFFIFDLHTPKLYYIFYNFI